jgi:hypothetical protein
VQNSFANLEADAEKALHQASMRPSGDNDRLQTL